MRLLQNRWVQRKDLSDPPEFSPFSKEFAKYHLKRFFDVSLCRETHNMKSLVVPAHYSTVLTN